MRFLKDTRRTWQCCKFVWLWKILIMRTDTEISIGYYPNYEYVSCQIVIRWGM